MTFPWQVALGIIAACEEEALKSRKIHFTDQCLTLYQGTLYIQKTHTLPFEIWMNRFNGRGRSSVNVLLQTCKAFVTRIFVSSGWVEFRHHSATN